MIRSKDEALPHIPREQPHSLKPAQHHLGLQKSASQRFLKGSNTFKRRVDFAKHHQASMQSIPLQHATYSLLEEQMIEEESEDTKKNTA